MSVFFIFLCGIIKNGKISESGGDRGSITSFLDSADSIHMITELKPIETRLNEIKQILKKQEQEVIEGEKKEKMT